MSEKRRKRAKRKSPEQGRVYSDFGTEERRNHGSVVIERIPKEMEDRDHRDHARAINTDDPLYRLRRQGTISAREKLAGELLRELWVDAQREPQTTAKYTQQIGRGSVQSAYVNGIDHHQRFIEIMRQFTPNVSKALMICVMQERLPRNRVKYARQGLARLQRIFRT